jgi:hypothetical protein
MTYQQVIMRAPAGALPWLRAADILGIHPRSLRRWRARYETDPILGLLDRRRRRLGAPAARYAVTSRRTPALCPRAAPRRPAPPSPPERIRSPPLPRAPPQSSGRPQEPFAPDAITALFHHTRGIPRLVQNVALAAMLAALETSKKAIDATAVQQAGVDLEAV